MRALTRRTVYVLTFMLATEFNGSKGLLIMKNRYIVKIRILSIHNKRGKNNLAA